MAHPGGRPPTIETAEEFDRRANAYFEQCRKKNEPILFTGLVLALGFSSKNQFYEYGKKEKFKESVSQARLIIENQYEQGLWNKDIQGGNIRFVLNSNFGWQEKNQVDHTSSDKSMSPSEVKVVFTDAKCKDDKDRA